MSHPSYPPYAARPPVATSSSAAAAAAAASAPAIAPFAHPSPYHLPSASPAPSMTTPPPGAAFRVAKPGDVYASAGTRELARAHLAMLLSSPTSLIVGAYYHVAPLDAAPISLCGAPALRYKAVSAQTGSLSTLLRILGPPPASSAQIVAAADAWKRVTHPGITCLRQVFTSTAFAAPVNELVFAYDMPVRADSLFNVFLSAPSVAPPDKAHLPHHHQHHHQHQHQHHQLHPLPEVTLWAVATQLLSALAVVHSHGLALRDSLSATTILVTGRNRVKVACVGLNDALDPGGADHILHPAASANSGTAANSTSPASKAIAALHKADLAAVGHVLATLSLRAESKAVRSGVLVCTEDAAVDALRRSTPYSDDLTVLIMSLLSAALPASSVSTNQILGMVGPRLALELGNVWSHADAADARVLQELDASRMFRLLALLGFVNERADAGVGVQWAETGDRYMLKLFRDYVFHRVDANGMPVLDMAHVVECLARLDVGSSEQVLLSSRDGASLLVASYDELRRCLMQSIDELRGIRPAR